MQHFTATERDITTGLGFPEGPVACADGSVILVEVIGNLTRVLPDGRHDVIAELGGGPNGAAIGPDGKVYVCNNGGFNWLREETGYLKPTGRADDYTGGRIERVDPETGEWETLYTHCDGQPLTGPNDIVFDAHGGFWFTDFGKVYGRTMDRGGLYYALADGSQITEAVFPFLTPNGIGISPDGATLYASETEAARLWAYPILGPGELDREGWPSPNGGRFLGNIPGFHRFDSLAVEAGGNVCVATLASGGVTVFSPEGEALEYHQVSDRYCTNICFGGPELTTAYITLSGSGRLVAVEWPRPGLALP